VDLLGEPRDRVFRDFAHERRLALRPAQDRLRFEGDLVQRILQDFGHHTELQKTWHLLIRRV
jgi:hypothetical protein